MCGIAGFYKAEASKETCTSVIRKMLTKIRHRGPDESGIYVDNTVCLGSVRLSIVDLLSGTMPISNENESLWIVFNGEIFNFKELRLELERKGYQFKTHTDTEVIVNLYEEYGPSFLSKLNGQFAIAIWDRNKKELFLARDRVGIRPLYFSRVNNEMLVFASEIKALLEFPEINLELCPKALSQYFTLWTTLGDRSPFKNIEALPPGHYLICNASGLRIEQYWKLPLYKPTEYKITKLHEAKEAFEHLFKDSVKLRMQADVPVAAYLSGGLDSSVTTAYIKNISAKNLKTFSIGFNDEVFDETPYQNVAADFFNTEHFSFKCSNEDISSNFESVVWHAEAPLLRTAPTPMMLLAKNVRNENIKVVITGEGADELLGGYNIFKETKIRHFWSKDPNSRIRPLLLKRLYPYIPQLKDASPKILKFFFGYGLEQTENPFYSHMLRWNTTSRLLNLLSSDFKREVIDYSPINELENSVGDTLDDYDYLTKAQFHEISIFMSNYLLTSQGDRMGMAHSVEGRYPFLDHRVIELCMSIHPDLKLRGLNEKFLLKQLMKGRLPDSILNRPKQAYRAPVNRAILSGKLPSVLTSDKLKEFNIFDDSAASKLITRCQNNSNISEIDNMALTAILSTQTLHKLFVKNSKGALHDEDCLHLDKIIIKD